MNNIIKIIDMPMGMGKTTGMINYMNNNTQDKFLFITPYLDEVQRIKTNCPKLNFKEPNGKYSKLSDLKSLLAEGENIVSTHALFSIVDTKVMELIKMNGYTLILDEVLEVVNTLDLAQRDLQLLLNDNVIKIEEDTKVTMADNSYGGKGCKFTKEIDTIKNQEVYYMDKSALLTFFNSEVFDCFDKCYVLTYLFEGSLMKSYFDLFNLKFDYAYIVDNNIIDGKFDDVEFRKTVKELINIYDGKLNAVGDKKTALSANWYKDSKKKEEHTVLKNNMYNYFRHITGCKSVDGLWSTFTGYNDNFKDFYTPRGFAKGAFLAFNTRATNNYVHKKTLIYAVNVYINPYMCRYFDNHNVEVNDDVYAVSTLLQWIWRSQIRVGEKIDVFIPSKRMRDLFNAYLNNEI